jgi:hypothetical protein
MEIEFEFERETKGTYRFKEIGDTPKVGTLYVKKYALAERPEKLKVTIEVVK